VCKEHGSGARSRRMAHLLRLLSASGASDGSRDGGRRWKGAWRWPTVLARRMGDLAGFVRRAMMVEAPGNGAAPRVVTGELSRSRARMMLRQDRPARLQRLACPRGTAVEYRAPFPSCCSFPEHPTSANKRLQWSGVTGRVRMANPLPPPTEPNRSRAKEHLLSGKHELGWKTVWS